MKKIISLSLFVFGLVLLESCCTERTCITYDLIEIHNYSFESLDRIEASQSIALSDYMIELESATTEQVCSIDLSFGTTLEAVSCDNWFLDDRISDISITSNADLTVGNEAGQELKSVFTAKRVNECASFVDNPADCIDDILAINNLGTLEQSFNEIYTEERFFNNERVFGFALKPISGLIDSTHQFTIVFSFESGTSITANTTEVNFQ